MFSIKKKIILCVAIISFLAIIINYFKPIQINELIAPYTDESLPNEINSSIFFSAYSRKELNINGEESIKEILRLIENIKVRQLLSPPSSWRPKFKSTYRFYFRDSNNRVQIIDILSDKYIRINENAYKIVGKPDLARIYDVIILEQPEGLLDEFYYNLIDMDE